MDLSTVFKVGQRFVYNDALFTITGFNGRGEYGIFAIAKETPVRFLFTESNFFGRWANVVLVPEIGSEEDVENLNKMADQKVIDDISAYKEKQTAFDRQKDAIAIDPQYAHLIPHRSCKPADAAKNIRRTLKKHYGKDVKFGVRLDRYTNVTTSITIKPSKKIEPKNLYQLVKPYILGSWNEVTDTYDYDIGAFNQVFGGVMYIILDEAD